MNILVRRNVVNKILESIKRLNESSLGLIERRNITNEILEDLGKLGGDESVSENPSPAEAPKQSPYPIDARRYSIEELSNPATYEQDKKLATIARQIAVLQFEKIFSVNMGRGEAKKAVLSGQYPELVLAAIEKNIEQQEKDYLDNQKGIEAALSINIKDYVVEVEGDELLIKGEFDNDLHQRIKRIGYWDGLSQGHKNRKCWVIPASKGSSLKTIFKNHLAVKTAREEEQQKAKAIAYEKARQAEIERRNTRIEQERKAALAKANRVKVEDGKYKVGDELNGKKIASFGSSWSEGGEVWVQVTDENSSAYGYQPGLDWYPKIKVSRPSTKYRYAYLKID